MLMPYYSNEHHKYYLIKKTREKRRDIRNWQTFSYKRTLHVHKVYNIKSKYSNGKYEKSKCNSLLIYEIFYLVTYEHTTNAGKMEACNTRKTSQLPNALISILQPEKTSNFLRDVPAEPFSLQSRERNHKSRCQTKNK